MINICEAVAHELAAVMPENNFEANLPASNATDGLPDWRDRLPFRSLIDNPLSLQRRPVLPAISTLTLRRDMVTGTATFLLHWRDPTKVASGGGLYQVMPAGMFQPATNAHADETNDFDVRRCMLREFSEELPGAPEHDNHLAATIDYQAWPLARRLSQARSDGALRVSCLGLGIDPLTLVADLLMVAVSGDQLFDQAFGEVVVDNAEGRVVGEHDQASPAAGIPFVKEAIERFTTVEPMQPAGAALLQLAWEQCEALLGM